MSVVTAGMRLRTLELVRQPSFLLPLAIFPTLLYLFFGTRQDGDPLLIMLGYCAFAILGTMMFQFGVGIAATRDDPWTTYTFTLPGTAGQRLTATLITGAVFSFAFCVPVVGAASITGALRPLPGATVVLILGALLVGAGVHGLLGLALAYSLPARGALGIANILSFALAYVGGLFGPVTEGIAGRIHPWTPTGAWIDLIYAAFTGQEAWRPLAVSAVCTVLFAIAAIVGYRRTERTVRS
jgi:ABC-2 type transport system permease protein